MGKSRISGWLSKWQNEVGDYVKMWFVLKDGIFSGYSTQDEVDCIGEMTCERASINFDETRKFAVSLDGEAIHLKADDVEDKCRWVQALTSAIESVPELDDFASSKDTKSTQDQISEPTLDQSQADGTLPNLNENLETPGNSVGANYSSNPIQECSDALRSSLSMLETRLKYDSSNFTGKLAECLSRAAVLAKSCKEYIFLAESIQKSSTERECKVEDIVHTLTARTDSSPIASSEDESFEYFDCCDIQDVTDVVLQVYHVAGQKRRTRIPDRPNVSDNLWSILKNGIGNDLSKMPLPVSFSEPLSLLQRLTEDFEYSHVLDKASECKEVTEQLAYVCGFISSSYSTTVGRSTKPFNPLLGETYECDRQSDLGWRSIAEQVSHHPPVAAVHCEGKAWTLHMDQSMKTKFKGTTLTVVPLGECYLTFKDGNRYAWKKPNTSIHNLIVGKLWVEQEGDVEIKCFTSKATCKLTFLSSGWFGETYSIKGIIKDSSGQGAFDIIGKYSTQIDCRPSGAKEPGTVVWQRTPLPPDSDKYYNFTVLACQLNEMEDGVAPTDSRHRPDQRLMEEGKFDEANIMKKKLEEFQRANKKDSWTPSWFKMQENPDTHKKVWTYQGEYWPCKDKKDWSKCPAYIFKPPDT